MPPILGAGTLCLRTTSRADPATPRLAKGRHAFTARARTRCHPEVGQGRVRGWKPCTGADIYPKAFELDLQTASLVGDEFALRGPVSCSGVEQVLVLGVRLWRRPLLLDSSAPAHRGRAERRHRIDDHGRPFKTAGKNADLPARRLVYGTWEKLSRTVTLGRRRARPNVRICLPWCGR